MKTLDLMYSTMLAELRPRERTASTGALRDGFKQINEEAERFGLG